MNLPIELPIQDRTGDLSTINQENTISLTDRAGDISTINGENTVNLTDRPILNVPMDRLNVNFSYEESNKQEIPSENQNINESYGNLNLEEPPQIDSTSSRPSIEEVEKPSVEPESNTNIEKNLSEKDPSTEKTELEVTNDKIQTEIENQITKSDEESPVEDNRSDSDFNSEDASFSDESNEGAKGKTSSRKRNQKSNYKTKVKK